MRELSTSCNFGLAPVAHHSIVISARIPVHSFLYGLQCSSNDIELSVSTVASSEWQGDLQAQILLASLQGSGLDSIMGDSGLVPVRVREHASRNKEPSQGARSRPRQRHARDLSTLGQGKSFAGIPLALVSWASNSSSFMCAGQWHQSLL